MKKYIIALFATLLPIVASADESGTCGYNLTWTFEEATGTLTINGTGDMSNYQPATGHYTPWHSIREIILKIVIDEGVTNIGNYAFFQCSGLTTVTIPEGVMSIGFHAFQFCSDLTSITIPEGVTSIGDYAFDGCISVTSITIPESVTSIGENAFSCCSSVTSITIPEGLMSIRQGAFSHCISITSITIPNSVTSIESFAFYECKGLTTIIIGKGVESIGSLAFADCTSLADVYCYSEKFPSTSSDIFSDSPIELATLYIPAMHITSYQSTYPWSGFKYILLLEGSNAERCAKPTISVKDGKIVFDCETPDASFVPQYETLFSSSISGNEYPLPIGFRITVYAQKYGLLDSPATTAEIEMSMGAYGDLNGDSQVNAVDVVILVNKIMGSQGQSAEF